MGHVQGHIDFLWLVQYWMNTLWRGQDHNPFPPNFFCFENRTHLGHAGTRHRAGTNLLYLMTELSVLPWHILIWNVLKDDHKLTRKIGCHFQKLMSDLRAYLSNLCASCLVNTVELWMYQKLWMEMGWGTKIRKSCYQAHSSPKNY